MCKMKKILVVLPELENGGGQRVALNIVANIKNPLIRIKVVSFYPRCGNFLEKYCDDNNIDIIYLNKRKGLDLKTILDLNCIVKDFKPDIIHAHLRVIPYLLVPSYKKYIKKKYYTVHSLADKDAKGILRFSIRIAFKYFGFVPIAISNTCKKSISDVYNYNMDKIPCIYNGIDFSKFKRNNDYQDLDDKKIIFVTVGRLMAEKNHKLLIEAFAKACCANNDLYLYIAGDGDLKDELLLLCKELQIENKVCFLGNVQCVEKWLNISHIFIMTSNYEGMPLSMLEAMACGLPIISTKAGGVVDIVEEGKNALLVNIGDLDNLVESILELAESKAKREYFSKNSMILSKNYSIESCSKKYEKLFLEN